MGAPDESLHSRSITDDAFYEWLLSDHPDARAERQWRRSTRYQNERDTAADIAAWAARINAADPSRHTQAARDLAASTGPRAAESLARAEAEAVESDELYVARMRAEFERHMRVSGPDWAYPDYRYPEHLTGASAANYPPPPSPDMPEPADPRPGHPAA